ncbi:MAG: cob(I)yrinic acid a,c-diamide adenosyltransferase [Deltaproteobacteria bacterium]|nr:cob(I)yrinic acid a,c-diamide adenosyltransferase [Deltaproteobacteria bacterium]MBI3387163.1 cob(I)yrinic acid a,c-diamide adenosyltransferase [Deltaproteobacteria bacterium]
MAIRITRVYTRGGDKGKTALVGGKRVPKDSPRIAAYGSVDELNAIVGLARTFNADGAARAHQRRLEDLLKRMQNQLFDLGSELATPPDAAYEGMYRISADDVKALEGEIDGLQTELTPLNSFILPGGGKVSAFLHQARTVCRRAERDILRLSRDETVGDFVLPWVNRLSDLLFVLSRWVSKQLGEPEFLWERGLRGHERKRKGA